MPLSPDLPAKQQSFSLSFYLRQPVVLAVLGLIAIRLIAMFLVPLNDTTEARYAEIARKMLETGNWVTLLHDYGVPFWAKPPLSTWLSAASMGLFGINELAVRLPALLLSIAVLALTYSLARTRLTRDAANVAVLVLASSILFLLSAGTVMTDPALMFCVALSQIAFWHAVALKRRMWGYIFFVGLGLGLLAKGPLVVVLVGMPIFFWVLLRRQWRTLWNELPWISGSILMFVIALPWYALAELRTPGFLNYFIMGEHVARFLDPGWKGDLYGFAHSTPHGMIWLYTLGALFPWSLLFIWRFVRKGRQALAQAKDGDGWLLYVSLWSLMTLAFFTLSGNIIFPYSLPMTPGFALLFATLWGDRDAKLPQTIWLAALSGLMILITCVAFAVRPDVVGRSQKALINAWKQDMPTPDSALLYWNSRREFSAEFYSHGRARTSTDPARARALLDNTSLDYIAIPDTDLGQLPPEVRQAFTEIGRYETNGQTFILLRERAIS
ncbi:MAG: glycosyltransferase family 39 protein [Formivibrio sp.]|nr:glycosyltransferase family 39 protein [Formivibrio sp.]